MINRVHMLLPLYIEDKCFDFLTEKDINKASEILGKSFANAEPMCTELKLPADDLTGLAKIFIEQSIKDGLNLGCFNQDGEIIGALITRDMSTEIDFSDVSETLTPIFALLEQLVESSSFWSKSDTANLALTQQGIGAELFMGGVCEIARNQGIVGQLTDILEALLIERKYTYCIAEATSPITQHLLEKRQWEKSNHILYPDFKFTNESVFSNIRIENTINKDIKPKTDFINGATFYTKTFKSITDL